VLAEPWEHGAHVPRSWIRLCG